MDTSEVHNLDPSIPASPQPPTLKMDGGEEEQEEKEVEEEEASDSDEDMDDDPRPPPFLPHHHLPAPPFPQRHPGRQV